MLQMPLYPPQQEVIDHGILDLGFSSVISLPTGAGKTTLAEMGMDRVLARGERAAYLTPLKALAEEKIAAWSDRWPGRKVGIFTGDYESSKVPVPYRDADILICTYERLDGILRHWQRHFSWLTRLGLVVVDEFHLLMDPGRGPRLEGAISRLRRVNPFCRVMGLSATVSNHADLAAWLGGVSYHSTWRPIPLQHEVRRYKRLADKTGLVIDIVAETHKSGGQTLIFASSRRRSEQMAKEVSAAGYPASHHHAGLGLTARKQVESDFREARLSCLVATPTLEMGLNLPCRAVVIADNTRWDGQTFSPLPAWNYLQRAGRAGRPGQDGVGRAILLAPAWARDVKDYGRSTPEPVRSHLGKPASLAEQILIEVSSRSSRTKSQLAGSFLPSTLAYRQDSGLSDRFTDHIDDLLESGLLVEDESGILHPTAVGWVAVRHHLSPASAKHVLRLINLDADHPVTEFDLLLHHCWDHDFQPQLPASIESIEVLEELIHEIPSQFLDEVPPKELTPRGCAAGVLMACLVWYMIKSEDTSPIYSDLDVYPYDAEVLRHNLVRFLKASADVLGTVDDKTDPQARLLRQRLMGPSLSTRILRLALQLEYGLPGDAVYLTLLPGCGGRLASRLLEAGITDLEDLCSREPLELMAVPGVGTKRAQSWIEVAEVLIKEIDPCCYPQRSSRPRKLATPSDWPSDIEPGRLQRATLLNVKGDRQGYWVTGGAEDHRVVNDECDCADFLKQGKGWWCKHRLAVRLLASDRLIKTLAARVTELSPPPSLAGYLADLALGRRWQNG